MKCPKCGKELPVTAKFCTKCGTRIYLQNDTDSNILNNLKDDNGINNQGAKQKQVTWKEQYTYIVIALVIVLAAIIGYGVKLNYHQDDKEDDLVVEDKRESKEYVEDSQLKMDKEDVNSYVVENEAMETEELQYDKVHPDFHVYGDIIEDYSNCLEPNKYCYYTSGVSDFYFWYPDNLYNAVTVEENVDGDYGQVLQTIHFYGSSGSELIFTIFQRNDMLSFDEIVDYIHTKESLTFYDSQDIVNSVTDDHGKVIITGWIDSNENFSVYDMIKVEQEYILQMKVVLTPYENENDRVQKAYVVENFYRMCGFSDSSKGVRNYREFVENY